MNSIDPREYLFIWLYKYGGGGSLKMYAQPMKQISNKTNKLIMQFYYMHACIPARLFLWAPNHRHILRRYVQRIWLSNWIQIFPFCFIYILLGRGGQIYSKSICRAVTTGPQWHIQSSKNITPFAPKRQIYK